MWTDLACTCPAPNILINVWYKVYFAGVSCGWVWRFWGILTSPTLEVIWALWGRKKLCLESTLQQNVAFFLLFPQGKTGRVFLCFPRLSLLRKNKKKSMQLKLLTAWHGRQAPRGEKQEKRKQKPKGKIPGPRKVSDCFLFFGVSLLWHTGSVVRKQQTWEVDCTLTLTRSQTLCAG